MRVNGRRPPPEGTLIEPERDQVTVHGAHVQPASRHRYLALHKPVGLLVSARDPQGRPTVFDLLAGETASGRLFAVGRLDVATGGLLLLTDDGELANRLTHPRHKVAKEYLARVTGTPSERDLRALRDGVELDGRRTLPAEVELVERGGVSLLRLVIREGRYRQVRRMLEAVGHPVRELTRTAIGPVRLGRLRPGSWRRLRHAELEDLRREVGLAP